MRIRIRFRIQLTTLTRIRMRIRIFIWCRCGFGCGSRVTKMMRIHNTGEHWALAEESLIAKANSPGFGPRILRHRGIWGAADEAVFTKVQFKIEKNPPKNPPVNCSSKWFNFNKMLANVVDPCPDPENSLYAWRSERVPPSWHKMLTEKYSYKCLLKTFFIWLNHFLRICILMGF